MNPKHAYNVVETAAPAGGYLASVFWGYGYWFSTGVPAGGST